MVNGSRFVMNFGASVSLIRPTSVDIYDVIAAPSVSIGACFIKSTTDLATWVQLAPTIDLTFTSDEYNLPLTYPDGACRSPLLGPHRSPFELGAAHRRDDRLVSGRVLGGALVGVRFRYCYFESSCRRTAASASLKVTASFACHRAERTTIRAHRPRYRKQT